MERERQNPAKVKPIEQIRVEMKRWTTDGRVDDITDIKRAFADDVLTKSKEVTRSADQVTVRRIPYSELTPEMKATLQGAGVNLAQAEANLDPNKPRYVKNGQGKFLELPPDTVASLERTRDGADLLKPPPGPRPSNLVGAYDELGISDDDVKKRGGKFSDSEIDAFKQNANEIIDGYAKGGGTNSGDTTAQIQARASVERAAEALRDPNLSRQAYAEFEMRNLRDQHASAYKAADARKIELDQMERQRVNPPKVQTIAELRASVNNLENGARLGLDGITRLGADDIINAGTTVQRSVDGQKVMRIPLQTIENDPGLRANLKINDLDPHTANVDPNKPRIITKGGQAFLELPSETVAALERTRDGVKAAPKPFTPPKPGRMDRPQGAHGRDGSTRDIRRLGGAERVTPGMRLPEDVGLPEESPLDRFRRTGVSERPGASTDASIDATMREALDRLNGGTQRSADGLDGSTPPLRSGGLLPLVDLKQDSVGPETTAPGSLGQSPASIEPSGDLPGGGGGGGRQSSSDERTQQPDARLPGATVDRPIQSTSGAPDRANAADPHSAIPTIQDIGHARAGKVGGAAGVGMGINNLIRGDHNDKVGMGIAVMDILAGVASVVKNTPIINRLGIGVQVGQGAWETGKSFVNEGAPEAAAKASETALIGVSSVVTATAAAGYVATTGLGTALATMAGGTGLPAVVGVVATAAIPLAAAVGTAVVTGVALKAVNDTGKILEESTGVGDKVGSMLSGGQALDNRQLITGIVDDQKAAAEGAKMSREDIANNLINTKNAKGNPRFANLKKYLAEHPEIKLDASSPQALRASINALDKSQQAERDALEAKRSTWNPFADNSEIDKQIAALDKARSEKVDFLKFANGKTASEMQANVVTAPREQKVAELNPNQREQLDRQVATAKLTPGIGNGENVTVVAAPTQGQGHGQGAALG